MSSAIPIPGRIKEITSVSNPLIKEIRTLDRKKNRDEAGVFLAEGLQLVSFAVETGWDLKTLIYAKNATSNDHLAQLATRARAHGTDLLEVSEKVLSAISRRDNPQSVLGVLTQVFTEIDQIKPKKEETWIALERVRDPGNLGTIMRTADAVGATGIILVGETTDPFSLETVRATMGSIFHVNVAKATVEKFGHWAENWRSSGGNIVGTHLDGAVDYRTIDYDTTPTLLLMGNEQQGLPAELAQMCDQLALIPMAGRAESLNLAIASGVMLFEMHRSRLKTA